MGKCTELAILVTDNKILIFHTVFSDKIRYLLPWQSGKNKFVCNSFSSSNLLPASYLAPCLPWVQQTVQRVWTTRQLASPTESAVQSSSKISQLAQSCCSELGMAVSGLFISGHWCYVAFIQEYCLCCFYHLHRHSYEWCSVDLDDQFCIWFTSLWFIINLWPHSRHRAPKILDFSFDKDSKDDFDCVNVMTGN